MTFDLSRRGLLAGALAVGGSTPFAAQADTATELPPAALLGDVDIFHRTYLALHPGLLRYNSPSQIEALFTALRRFCGRPRSLAATHLAFARTVAQLRCGHSYLNPYNQLGPALTLIEGGRTRLPFLFLWIDGRMIVIDDPARSIAAGSEILSIGGMAPRIILRALLPYACADGHNDAKRVRLMEVRGESAWELFDIYFPMLFPQLVAGGAAQIALRTPDGRVRKTELALITQADRRRMLKAQVVANEAEAPAWIFKVANGAAWLTMPTWAFYDSKWNWRAAIDGLVDGLIADKIPALVIDLRGNGGGEDVGDAILARVIDRELVKTDQRRFVRYRRTPADLDPYLKTWDRSFRDWGDKAVGPGPDGFYRLTRFDDGTDGDIIRPTGERYTGRVTVIVDASNSSATFSFANLVKQHRLATLVGQTTGGNRRGINGGAFFFLRLPGSGLEVDVPLIGYFPPAAQPDEGVEPDVPVLINASDVAAGVDRERIETMRLLAV